MIPRQDVPSKPRLHISVHMSFKDMLATRLVDVRVHHHSPSTAWNQSELATGVRSGAPRTNLTGLCAVHRFRTIRRFSVNSVTLEIRSWKLLCFRALGGCNLPTSEFSVLVLGMLARQSHSERFRLGVCCLMRQFT